MTRHVPESLTFRTGPPWSQGLKRAGVATLVLPTLLLLALAADGSRAPAQGRASAPGSKEADAREGGRSLLVLRGHRDRVFGIRFSPDGKRLASASGDRLVRVWDAATGKLALTLEGHTALVYGVTFSPDGKRLASVSGGWGEDPQVQGEMIVWDALTGRKALTLKGHKSAVYGVAFSPDGKRLASGGGDRVVKVWDVASEREVLALIGHTGAVYGVAFSPDGKYLASASGDFFCGWRVGEVKLWDLATGREAFTLKGHRATVYGVAFSPDGRRLATAGHDRTVKVWEVSTGREALSLTGHTSAVFCVTFSPDGRRLASAGEDGTVRIWEAITGEELLCLEGHIAQAAVVAFSPDGTRLASANAKGYAVTVWDGTRLREGRPLWRAAPSPADLGALWADLAGEDARKAYRAVGALAAAATRAVPFLRERLRPAGAPAPNPRRARLIADLDHDRFDVREKATEELAKEGKAAGPALREALEGRLTLEARRRALGLLERLGPQVPSGEGLRGLRAVEALERMGSPAAQRVLQGLARGSSAAPLTREARASLARLRGRPAAVR
jgi:sugar lactone lactonase YvrE